MQVWSLRMTNLTYKRHQLFFDKVSLADIATKFGTPCYVYSKKQLEKNWQVLQAALQNLPHRICYAVKANSNLAILQLFHNWGSGFDIVSGGELARVIKAGAAANAIIFSGVG